MLSPYTYCKDWLWYRKKDNSKYWATGKKLKIIYHWESVPVDKFEKKKFLHVRLREHGRGKKFVRVREPKVYNKIMISRNVWEVTPIIPQ